MLQLGEMRKGLSDGNNFFYQIVIFCPLDNRYLFDFVPILRMCIAC